MDGKGRETIKNTTQSSANVTHLKERRLQNHSVSTSNERKWAGAGGGTSNTHTHTNFNDAEGDTSQFNESELDGSLRSRVASIPKLAFGLERSCDDDGGDATERLCSSA